MPKIIVLRAVFDDSDIQTDYFHRDRSLEKWYVSDLEGSKVTEGKLRRALKNLPAWLRNFNWRFMKGEKYSMSDHYYGQLRVDQGVGLTVKNGWGHRTGLRFILTVTSLSAFEMNHNRAKSLPQSLEEVQELIEQKERESEERIRKVKENMKKVMPKIIQNTYAVIDKKGFHVLTRKEKQEMLDKYIN